MLYKFFDENLGSGAMSKKISNLNEVLSEELHKPVIKKFKRRKVYARVKDNIWAGDFAQMASESFKHCGIKYLLCVIDVFTKYPWVKPLNNKKAMASLNGFIEIVNKPKREANNLWVD